MSDRLWTLTGTDRQASTATRLREVFAIDIDQKSTSRFSNVSLLGFDVIDNSVCGDSVYLLGNRRIVLNSAHLLHKARVRRLVKDTMRAAVPDLYAYIGEAA